MGMIMMIYNDRFSQLIATGERIPEFQRECGRVQSPHVELGSLQNVKLWFWTAKGSSCTKRQTTTIEANKKNDTIIFHFDKQLNQPRSTTDRETYLMIANESVCDWVLVKFA